MIAIRKLRRRLSEELETFLTYVAQLEFEARPDYARCKKIFSDALKRRKLPLDGKVDFSAPKSPVKKVREQNQQILLRARLFFFPVLLHVQGDMFGLIPEFAMISHRLTQLTDFMILTDFKILIDIVTVANPVQNYLF